MQGQTKEAILFQDREPFYLLQESYLIALFGDLALTTQDLHYSGNQVGVAHSQRKNVMMAMIMMMMTFSAGN